MICYKQIMGKVLEIGITNKKGSQIEKVMEVQALKGKGLAGDRKFRENNLKHCQITLIEIENRTTYINIFKIFPKLLSF